MYTEAEKIAIGYVSMTIPELRAMAVRQKDPGRNSAEAIVNAADLIRHIENDLRVAITVTREALDRITGDLDAGRFGGRFVELRTGSFLTPTSNPSHRDKEHIQESATDSRP